jgi:hypothetical protein
MNVITIGLYHFTPTFMQTMDAIPIELWRLRYEKVGQIGFQVVSVGVLLSTHVTVQGNEKVIIGRGKVGAVGRMRQHLPAQVQ